MATSNEHTVKAFDADISRMRGLISEMGGRVEQALAEAMTALVNHDLSLANEVVAGDARIDELETEVERQAVQMIALRAPMADDLREVIAAIKMAGVVERVGDYAKNIAKRVHILGEHRAIEAMPLLRSMAGIAQDMVHDALDAFAERDAGKCLAVCERDRLVDDFYDSIFRTLLSFMMENPKLITESAHLLFIAKNIERIGDQATNVAEIVYYAVTGDYMAQREKGGQSGGVPTA